MSDELSRPTAKFVMMCVRQVLFEEAGLTREELRKIVRDSIAGRVESSVRYVIGNTPELKREIIKQIPAAAHAAVREIIHKEVTENLRISLYRAPPAQNRERSVDLDGT